jgi:integrase/recombinase XerD
MMKMNVGADRPRLIHLGARSWSGYCPRAPPWTGRLRLKVTNTGDASDGLASHHIEAFLDRLRTARHSEVTLCKNRWGLSAFSRSMISENVAAAHLDESTIASFMKRLTSVPAARIQFALAVLRIFLAYLRGEAIARLPTLD